MDDLTLEKMGLENDYLKTQIAGSVKAIGNTSASNVAPVDNTGGDVHDVIKRIKPHHFQAQNSKPLLRIGVDSKGNPLRVYNEDLGDNEVLQALTALPKQNFELFLKECEWRFNEGSPKQLLEDLKIILKENY